MTPGGRRAGGLLALLMLLAGAAPAAVVINEVDYDQPGSDIAEFIELYNTGPGTVNLLGWSVELVNGANSQIYKTFDLPDFDLAVGGFFVICANPDNTPNCNLQGDVTTNMIQNGAPDAVILRDFGDALVEAVCYEGEISGFGEGSGVNPGDGSYDYQCIGRYPDGADSDDNSADFTVQCAWSQAWMSGVYRQGMILESRDWTPQPRSVNGPCHRVRPGSSK